MHVLKNITSITALLILLSGCYTQLKTTKPYSPSAQNNQEYKKGYENDYGDKDAAYLDDEYVGYDSDYTAGYRDGIFDSRIYYHDVNRFYGFNSFYDPYFGYPSRFGFHRSFFGCFSCSPFAFAPYGFNSLGFGFGLGFHGFGSGFVVTSGTSGNLRSGPRGSGINRSGTRTSSDLRSTERIRRSRSDRSIRSKQSSSNERIRSTRSSGRSRTVRSRSGSSNSRSEVRSSSSRRRSSGSSRRVRSSSNNRSSSGNKVRSSSSRSRSSSGSRVRSSSGSSRSKASRNRSNPSSKNRSRGS